MKYFFFLICIFKILSAQSQDLSLKTINKRTGREKIQKEKYEIKVFAKSDTTKMGNYFILDSNSIVVNNDTVQIADVQKIYIKNNFSKGFGIYGIVNGVGGSLGGLILISVSRFVEDGLFFKGAFIAGIGYISLIYGTIILIPSVILMVNGTKYSGKEYLFKIE